MAHIRSFTVKGLAGRKDSYQRDVNRDVNIFFGANGSGKTSLLRILDSAMSGDASILQRVPFTSAEVTIYSEQYGRSFVRSVSRLDEVPIDSHQSSSIQRERDSALEEDLLSLLDTEESLSWKTEPARPDVSRSRWRHTYLPTWRAFHTGSQSTLTRTQQSSLFRSPNDTDSEHDWDIAFAERLEQLWIRYSNNLLGEIQSIQGEGLASILGAIVSPNFEGREVEPLEPDTAYRLVIAFLERQGTADILGSSEEFSDRYEKDPQLRGCFQSLRLVLDLVYETQTIPQ